MGVVGIIYESRPNVTADAFGLCFKTGNVCVLKGGSDAIHSNIAIVAIIKEALQKHMQTTEFIEFGQSTKDLISGELGIKLFTAELLSE